MTYGYRLNVEDLFLKHADECWNYAQTSMVEISDAIPETGKEIVFIGPEDEECVSKCVQAIVGWAICIESYVNLSWNSYEKTQTEPEKLRALSTYEKIKRILKYADIDLSDKYWLADIKELFLQRNNLVHYKETITYYGFSFAPEYQKDLSKSKLSKYRKAVEQTIAAIGSIAGIETKSYYVVSMSCSTMMNNGLTKTKEGICLIHLLNIEADIHIN